MSSERRYSEGEVAAIFEAATHQTSEPPGDGLTLAEVQGIGDQVGIPSERIARAAAALDRAALSKVATPNRFAGLPITLSRTVSLPSRASAEEWSRLVSDLDDVFQVPGEVVVQGSLYRWQNDDLVATLSPRGAGSRLRLATRRSHPWGLFLGGLFALGFAAFLAIVMAAKGVLGVQWAPTSLAILPGLLGLFALAASAHQFPRWRALWERRLKTITRRALDRANAPTVRELTESGQEER